MRVKLGEYIEQIRGVSYKPEDICKELNENTVILLRANNIQDGKLNLNDIIYVKKEKVKQIQYLMIGDILICTSSGSKNLVGKAVFINKNLTVTFGAFCKVVRPKISCPQYLGHFFNSPYYRNIISNLSAGANINNIRNKDIDELKIFFPSQEEQEKIVAVLNKVSDLIALRKKQLEKLEELVKARFVEMFGESRNNPKKWNIFKLEEISDVGSSKRVFVEELVEKGIPFYRGTEIGALAVGEKIIPELFIKKEHYKILCKSSGTPTKGDLLMPSICSDGRIWLVNNDEPFYFKDGRVLWIHSISQKINNCYLQYVLKEKFITEYKNIASGTTFAELKIFALKALPIMVPPIELQEQFAHFVTKVDKQKLTIQQSLDKLEVLKRALMQQYFG